MRYLTKQRLYGPFLLVTQPLSYGIPTRKGKEPPRSPSSPSSSSEEEETTQIHIDMLTLLSAGIHPHFLLYHHLIHPSTEPFSGDSLDEGVSPAPHSPPPQQLNLEDISPHKIVPDYPFLTMARHLIEVNMKEAWANLINITQDITDVVDDDQDEDEDEDYSDEDEDYSDEDKDYSDEDEAKAADEVEDMDKVEDDNVSFNLPFSS